MNKFFAFFSDKIFHTCLENIVFAWRFGVTLGVGMERKEFLKSRLNPFFPVWK